VKSFPTRAIQPLLAGLACAMLTAACGAASAPSSGSPPAAAGSAAASRAASPSASTGLLQFDSSDRQANLKALYDKAKAEGEVVFKGGLEDYVKSDLATAFAQDYPCIKVTHAVVPNPQVPPQIITEATANKISTDVGFGNVTDVIPLDERGILLQYDWGKLVDPNGQAEFDNKLLHMYDTVSVLGYNTDVLKGDAVPKTWDDLLNPRFANGKMGFTSEAGAVFGGAFLDRGENETLAFLDKLKLQKPVYTSKGAEAAQKLAAGQLSIATMPIAQFMDLKSKSAPVAMSSVGPFTVRHLNVYSVKGAPHPNAAVLFMAWTTTAKAHQILSRTARDLMQPCNAGPSAQAICDGQVKLIALDTLEKVKRENDFQVKAQKTLGITPS